jgi:MerR family transcriptional regulator, thiopeptide resistance regulator
VTRFGGNVRARIEEAKTRIKGWSTAEFDQHLAEVERIEVALAKAHTEGVPADSVEVSELIRRLHGWIGRGWNEPPSRERFIGLAAMYQEHADFRARYESRAPGPTDYIATAINAFAERELA